VCVCVCVCVYVRVCACVCVYVCDMDSFTSPATGGLPAQTPITLMGTMYQPGVNWGSKFQLSISHIAIR